MHGVLQDLRYGLRASAKHPVFTAITVLVLALGTGATTAVFSVVNSVLLKPIEFPNSERMVRIYQTHPRWGGGVTVAPPDYMDWRVRARSFEHLAAFRDNELSWSGRQEPERVPAAGATANLFAMLGAKPALGRLFVADDERRGHDQVVLVTHKFWTGRLGADPAAVGKTLVLDSKPHTIIGVLPQGFSSPSDAQLFVPLAFRAEELASRGSHSINVIALLRPGAGLPQAQSEMAAIAGELEREHPSDEENKSWGVRLVSVFDDTVAGVRQTLWIAFGVVACVLLIACANIANLMLARASGRTQEIAIRAAVGAGRSRIVRQLLTESLALAAAGVALGAVLAHYGIRLLVAVSPGNIPRLEEIGLDMRVLAFSAALAALTGLAFGLVPALGISRVDLAERLKQAGAAVVGGHRRRAGAVLIVADVAIAVLLATGAALLVNSFLRVRQVDPGFDAGNLLVATVNLPRAKYSEPQSQIAFIDRTLERLRVLPGVEHAGSTQVAPFNGNWLQAFQVDGARELPLNEQPSANYYSVSPGYFAAMRIRLVKGRLFTERDGRAAPDVLIINEAMERRWFPGQNPVGKRIRVSAGGNTWREIVGVVGDVKQTRLDAEAPIQMYEPFPHRPTPLLAFVIRTASDPMQLALPVKRAVAEVDKDQPVSKLLTMEAAVALSIARRRFSTLLLAIAAAVILLLAVAGLYGVVAHAVAGRTREIGLRMALGATSSDIARAVLATSMALVAVGLALGLAASAAAARLLRHMLFGITVTDVPTYAAATSILLAAVLIAMWIPTRRATRVDPVKALRQG